jgi:hypothetical protein
MAEFVLLDATVEIGASGGALVDLSDHVRSVTIDYSAESPEKTAMGDTTKTRLPGLLDWKIDVEFNQDYAAANVDATLFSLVGAAVDVDICATSDVAAPTTPHFTGSGIITTYNPLGGKVGDTNTTKVTIVGGTTVLSRITA